MPPKKAREPLKCMWLGCPCDEEVYSCVEELASHVKASHIESFANEESVVCLWEGCRVYNVPSTSYSWLQKHVQQIHTKERPHRCIMNGCSRSFNSPEALSRHLQVHFISPAVKVQRISVPVGTSVTPIVPSAPAREVKTEEPPRGGAAVEGSGDFDGAAASTKPPEGRRLASEPAETKGTEITQPAPKTKGTEIPQPAPKPAETKGTEIPQPAPKRSRTAKPQPMHHAAMNSNVGFVSHNGIHPEVLDPKTMSVIRKTVCHLAQHDKYHSPGVDNYISLQPKVIARRKRPQYPEPEFLIRWVPPIASDMWVPVSQYEGHSQFFSFHDLSPWQLSTLAQVCFGSKLNRRTKRKL